MWGKREPKEHRNVERRLKGKKRFIEIISEEYDVWKRQEEEKK